MKKYETIAYATFPFEGQKDYDSKIKMKFVFEASLESMKSEGRNGNIKSVKYIKRSFDQEKNKYKEEVVDNRQRRATEVVIELKTGTRILETPFALYVQRDLSEEYSNEDKKRDIETLSNDLAESKEVIDICYPKGRRVLAKRKIQKKTNATNDNEINEEINPRKDKKCQTTSKVKKLGERLLQIIGGGKLIFMTIK